MKPSKSNDSNITPEIEQLLLSIAKQDKSYVEGVIMHPRLTGLFRNIPPKPYLLFAGTSQDEKARRKKIMNKHSCKAFEADLVGARTQQPPFVN